MPAPPSLHSPLCNVLKLFIFVAEILDRLPDDHHEIFGLVEGLPRQHVIDYEADEPGTREAACTEEVEALHHDDAKVLDGADHVFVGHQESDEGTERMDEWMSGWNGWISLVLPTTTPLFLPKFILDFPLLSSPSLIITSKLYSPFPSSLSQSSTFQSPTPCPSVSFKPVLIPWHA